MIIYSLDLLGTFFFAISGTWIAIQKKMDSFGIFIIAFVTAVGGGTLRDLLIGITPLSWMVDLNYIYVIASAVIVGIFLRGKKNWFVKPLILFDAIGLGVFTLIGIQKGVELNLHPIICIAFGTMSASFGGVIRDILCNEVPVIFKKEVYATTCIVGGIFYFLLTPIMHQTYLLIGTALLISSLRLLAVKFKFELPKLKD